MSRRTLDSPRLARLLVNLILQFYPQKMRIRFGPELKQFVAQTYDEWIEARNGRAGSAFWLRIFWDLLRNAAGIRASRPCDA